MEKLYTTPHASRFVIVCCCAMIVGLAALPAVASISAHLSPWAAAGVILGIVGLLSVAVTEAWRHWSR